MPILPMSIVAGVLWTAVVVAMWAALKHPGEVVKMGPFRELLYVWGILGAVAAVVVVLAPLFTHTFLPGVFYAWLFGGVWAPVFLALGTFSGGLRAK